MTNDLFSRHTQKAFEWINHVNNFLGWEQKSHVLDTIRVVLHEVRNHLPLIDAVHLSTQLPLIIRGIYFEGWQPTHVPVKERRREEFIHKIRYGLEHSIRRSFSDLETERIILSVFEALVYHTNEREWDKLYKILPSGVKEFIP